MTNGADDGTWDQALAALTAEADREGWLDRSISVDSTIARVREHATRFARHIGTGSNYTNPLVELAHHAVGRSRGSLTTKIHQLAGGAGLPLVIQVASGQPGARRH